MLPATTWSKLVRYCNKKNIVLQEIKEPGSLDEYILDCADKEKPEIIAACFVAIKIIEVFGVFNSFKFVEKQFKKLCLKYPELYHKYSVMTDWSCWYSHGRPDIWFQNQIKEHKIFLPRNDKMLYKLLLVILFIGLKKQAKDQMHDDHMTSSTERLYINGVMKFLELVMEDKK